MSNDKPDALRKVSLGGSIIAAISASLCCLGPIIAVSIGASGFAAASAFARWRPLFLVLTFALLGLAWFLTYRKPKTCPEDSPPCPTSPASRWNKLVLVLATTVVLAFAAFPYLSSAALRLLSSSGQQTNAANPAVLKVSIPSMDCAACAASIQKQLIEQPGVQKAQVRFDSKEALVYYDANTTSRDQVIRAINNTGFKAEPPDKQKQ
jgi:copper chaperone CopZ